MDVLLVEDDLLARRSQQLILQGSGCKVTVATNADEAAQAANDHRFDLIFMDIGLPNNDGIVAAEWIHASKQNGDTPIVALTGFLDRKVHQRCIDAGMKDVIVKPISADIFDRLRADMSGQDSTMI